ncbi:DUF4354 family protein [Pantoea sp. JKS000250]|uniref:DUF4354 family protein n=1 Tax=Pantoea sp. JKS000250 TaxID=1938795 RepID=UPI000D76854A|nr:DUF4354 family protein [Pantoea sp. JKS000250]PXW15949.1 uncharacterized protein DUF4354 [Pantoea sp. JKS000250]
MKKLTTTLVSSLILFSFSSIASEDLHNKLIIQATPSSEGTVVLEGHLKYEKTFDLLVYSKIKEPIELTGFVGCYKAFDEKGKEFDEFSVQEDLLGVLKDGSKKGKVSFIGEDDSIYNARFVKWSSQCPELAKRPQ